MAIISEIKQLVYRDPRLNRPTPRPPIIRTSPLGGVFRVTKRWDLHGRYFIEFRLGRFGSRDEIEVTKETYGLLPLGARFHSVGSEFADGFPGMPSRMELERQ